MAIDANLRHSYPYVSVGVGERPFRLLAMTEHRREVFVHMDLTEATNLHAQLERVIRLRLLGADGTPVRLDEDTLAIETGEEA